MHNNTQQTKFSSPFAMPSTKTIYVSISVFIGIIIYSHTLHHYPNVVAVILYFLEPDTEVSCRHILQGKYCSPFVWMTQSVEYP